MASIVTKSAPWKQKLQQSLKENASLVYAKYCQLATVRPEGGPAVRTVVFRGFLNNTDDLTFITDSRTKKVQEVAANPAAEVAWYFPNTREQYRLTGKLTIIGAQHQDTGLLAARQKAWDALSDNARLQFSWPEPGLPRDIDPEAFKRPAPGPKEEPLPTFCLVVLNVKAVDYVQLFDNLRSSYSLGSNGAWGDAENINP